VSLDAHDSLLALIKLGVPQGSVLGPLLFIIYMDELPRSIETPVYLFADDTVLLACDDNLNNLITKINHEFKKLCLYFRKFRLSLNPKKTQYMIFSNSPEVHAANVQVFINNNNDGENFAENMHEIKRIKPDDENPTYKYLGIYMDPNFTFKHHVEKILSKLSRALFMLRQFKNFLPEKSLKLLYYTLFHCHLIYAAEVWTSASESLLNKLFLKQKAAIRIITNSKYNAHTQPLFKKLEILPLHDLYRYQRMIFFQAIIQKKGPTNFDHIWTTNRERRMLNRENDRELRNDGDFYVPFSRTESLRRSLYFTLPDEWNQLPPDLQIIRKQEEFKMKLKTYFLNKIPEQYVCTRLFCPSCNNT